MRIFVFIPLILVSTFLVCCNFEVPSKVSNVPDTIILFYHIIVLFVSWTIVVKNIKEPNLRDRYYLFFLINYSISLFLTYYYWTPYLIKEYDPSTWGSFDPIKYYAMAVEMVKGTFIYDVISFPVVWIYYSEFLIFGYHPLVPFFINVLFYLYSVIILAKYICEGKQRQLKYYVWLLLIPEMIYFSLTASKDIICVLCSTMIFVISQNILDGKHKFIDIAIGIIVFFILSSSISNAFCKSCLSFSLTVTTA